MSTSGRQGRPRAGGGRPVVGDHTSMKYLDSGSFLASQHAHWVSRTEHPSINQSAGQLGVLGLITAPQEKNVSGEVS